MISPNDLKEMVIMTHLKEEMLETLARVTDVLTFDEKEFVFREGDRAERFYMVKRGKVLLARLAVAAFGVVAWVMAVRADAVYELVETASAFGSAGIVTVVVLGLFTRFGGPAAALASLLGGVTAWVAGAYVLAVPYPFLTSVAVAVSAYVAAGLLGSRAAPPAR